MKIGPFTPPDVRAAIEYENEHLLELPLVTLPQLDLEIAGVKIRILEHEGHPYNFVTERILSPFMTTFDSAPDFVVDAQLVHETFFVPEGSVGNTQVHMHPEFWEMNISHWHFRWDVARHQTLTVRYLGGLERLIGALRLFLGHQLISNQKGFLLHASAAVVEEKTFVFLGSSGAGKSTSAYFTTGKLLSDETVAIVKDASGALTARGTPFGGEHFPSGAIGPHPTFLFVEKSSRNALESLPVRNSVARLLSQVVLFPFAPMALWDQTAALVDHILNTCPVQVLHATQGGTFWKECLT